MVSEKVVVVLMIVAILLSAASVFVTLSALNMKSVPSVNIIQGATEDSGRGQVNIFILPPENMQNSSEQKK